MNEQKKILIIEDEAALQQALIEFLGAENFAVVSAVDGQQGLELAKSEDPDLVLLDIILPKLDGYAVLEELKKNAVTKNTPVILLTNLESAEDIQKAFDKGATTYLVKSEYRLEDIVKKIKETLKM
ncbi:MAG: response regulator [Candidatus Pacebacteria bacterium]|nr:response regulator [Candidatus Paceibacterota bacterium]MDR3582964.1 response regulator [Candidatus Paceibacterota bacterium]